MTTNERLARWYIKKYLPNMHLAYNPGQHPETRKALNEAVSKTLENMEAEFTRANMEHEQYYERRRGKR